MEEFQEITHTIFITKGRKLSKTLKYVEEQRRFSKGSEDGRKMRAYFAEHVGGQMTEFSRHTPTTNIHLR